jgi:hypothetical protein
MGNRLKISSPLQKIIQKQIIQSAFEIQKG